MRHPLTGSFCVLVAALAFSPDCVWPGESAIRQRKKPPVASSAPTKHLSHDLSGVWMQYDDGTAPGFARMNGVDDRTRPPLTPWGQEKFDAAKPLMGPRAVGGSEDSAALHCDPSGPPQLLILPNPWEIVQIPGRMFMFFEEYHIWRTIWTDGPAAAQRSRPQLARLLGGPLGGRHLRCRNGWLQRQSVGRSFRKSAQRADAPDGTIPSIES